MHVNLKFRIFFRKLRQKDYYNFKVTLVYTVNSGLDKATS